MAMEMIPSPPMRRSARHYILAAVFAVLVAVAIVAAISISLSPGHISFSVANATLSRSAYNLTITANNTSGRRVAVAYHFMSAEIWSSPTTSFPREINIDEMLPAGQRQGPRSAATFNVLIDYKQYDLTTNNSTGSFNDYDTKVVVVAKVRFWIDHVVPTRPYTVRGTCMHVDFVSRHNASYFPVNCGMY